MEYTVCHGGLMCKALQREKSKVAARGSDSYDSSEGYALTAPESLPLAKRCEQPKVG